MQAAFDTVVVLGMGGTIAGRGADLGYRAGALGPDSLLNGIDTAGARVEVEEVARIDSKDLAFADWRALVDAVGRSLARPEVRGIAITHGTDTLEETAYLLQRVHAPARPVVLVGAMRPADSRQSDGPQNLVDALQVAQAPGARGVVAVFAGAIWHGLEVRKRHAFRLDAFGAGDAGPIGVLQAGRLAMFRDWPVGEPLGATVLPDDPDRWPIVEIVASHAGARAATVDALVAAGAEGLVIATAGNGSVHAALEPALVRASRAGVALIRATRCLDGGITDPEAAGDPVGGPSAGRLTPVQARVELMLRIAAGRRGAAPG